MALRISEIFFSLQGEARTVGWPTVFIRLTGCPLRCVWCDTDYAFQGGERMSIDAVLAQVATYPAQYVTVTGGEPLAQPECLPLLQALCDAGYAVSLETSGAFSIQAVDERVSVVLDVKAPGSGESHRNLWENLPLLKAKDQVKFVLANREDYQWARLIVDQHTLHKKAGEVLFSPVWAQLQPAALTKWIIDDDLPVRFQLQIKKVLWQDAKGR